MTPDLICKLQIIATKQLQLEAQAAKVASQAESLSKRTAKLSAELQRTLKDAEATISSDFFIRLCEIQDLVRKEAAGLIEITIRNKTTTDKE